MHTNNITICEWTENQFKNSEKVWGELLERSNADRLFLSWEWLYTWWNLFSTPQSMQLKLLTAIDENDRLVGIAPLYISKVTTIKFVSTKRLQFIGCCWRGKVTMKTELLEFISDKTRSQEVVNAFYRSIRKDSGWSEFVLADLLSQSDTCQILISQSPFGNVYYRLAEQYKSYYLPLAGDFATYVKQLGKNTRLRVFNRRNILEQTGSVRLERCSGQNIDENFELLNELHIKRWKRPAFPGIRLEFNKTVAKLMAKRGAFNFSVLYVNDIPVSIQYNYILGDHEYNIQAGFDENFHKKLALGYLHFGYEIEDAYSKRIASYDFLAGEGKNIQYKARLTQSSLEIVDVQVIRNKPLGTLYRLHDFFHSLRADK